ncbi:MAG: hypothetical protein JST96_05460 [Bacteroidetes bacterium]|nr:hypothetical protein [Bacteroidota bacterium]
MEELILVLRKDMQLELADNISLEEIKEQLAGYVNDLISNDFEKLVSLLYRVDVSEKKLKKMLNENKNTDAGKIIAELIIERQAQKIKTRNEYKKRDDVSDEEKW